MTFDLCLGQALGPLYLIPIDFEVSAQAQFMRGAGQEDVLQIDEAGFLTAGRETEICLGGAPSAVTVRNFEA